MGKDFDKDGLEQIYFSLKKLKEKYNIHPNVSKHLDFLAHVITVYKSDPAKINYPDILKNSNEIITDLKVIPKEEVTGLVELIKKECRLCMFHADDCFMNILFLIFKSIESGKLFEPNRLRPTLRYK
ncbi:MAG: hypothetical protein A2014_11590 [Spirochaetes bacterium GWF1_49_6]|nr:MAG: hypothetical protein A2014_11590 [Spirochaetes bacterium GWF1_49_6]